MFMAFQRYRCSPYQRRDFCRCQPRICVPYQRRELSLTTEGNVAYQRRELFPTNRGNVPLPTVGASPYQRHNNTDSVCLMEGYGSLFCYWGRLLFSRFVEVVFSKLSKFRRSCVEAAEVLSKVRGSFVVSMDQVNASNPYIMDQSRGSETWI